MEVRKNQNYAFFITILCVLLIIVNVVSISLAFFTDKATTKSAIITLGKIDIDAKFVSEEGQEFDDFTFESANVITGETIQRKINIKNVDAESCAIRMKIEFSIDQGNGFEDKTANNYLTLSVATENSQDWTENEQNQYWYYNNALEKNKDFNVITIMTLQDNLGRDSFDNYVQTIKYKITLKVEAVQVDNDGYKTEWSGQMPANWSIN